jgi:hypothetical protein
MPLHGRITVRVFNKTFYKYARFFDINRRIAEVMEWRSEDVSLPWLLAAVIGYK